mgnify:CR=1 FL=1
MQPVLFRDLGLIDYKEAWEYQEKLFQELICLLYTSDAADERSSVDLGGRRIIKKKNTKKENKKTKKKRKNKKKNTLR